MENKKLNQESNPIDVISMDIPFLIRVMEYSKEDAKTDMDLHVATEKMIALSKEGKKLTMEDYDSIFATKQPKEINENAKKLIKTLIRKQITNKK